MSGDEDTDSLEDYVHEFISANGIKSDVEVVDKGDYVLGPLRNREMEQTMLILYPSMRMKMISG